MRYGSLSLLGLFIFLSSCAQKEAESTPLAFPPADYFLSCEYPNQTGKIEKFRAELRKESASVDVVGEYDVTGQAKKQIFRSQGLGTLSDTQVKLAMPVGYELDLQVQNVDKSGPTLVGTIILDNIRHASVCDLSSCSKNSCEKI